MLLIHSDVLPMMNTLKEEYTLTFLYTSSGTTDFVKESTVFNP